MFTTADLPATMRHDPAQPHTCTRPDCTWTVPDTVPENPRSGASRTR